MRFISLPSYKRSIASVTISILMSMRKMPLANPAKVSIFPSPYGKRILAGHLLITAAHNPTANARQSKSMWMLSLRSPKDPVARP